MIANAFAIDPVTHEPALDAYAYLAPIVGADVPSADAVTTAWYWLRDVSAWPVVPPGRTARAR